MDSKKSELLDALRRKGSLIRESEWMRIYRIAPDHFYHESKFLMDDIRVSADSIKKRWQNLSPEERSEFALAFSAKRRYEAEDQEILRFLMDVGTENEWQFILIRLPQFHDREYALRFVIEKLSRKPRGPANYYQALELIGDNRGLPILRERYDEYRQKLAPFEQHGFWSELTEYQVCCRALWKLTGLQEYETALRDLLAHPDEGIRRRAEMFLSK